MKLIATINAYYSKRDTNGNTYWAFTFIDHETGKSCAAIADGESNIRSLMHNWTPGAGWQSNEFIFTTRKLPKREFQRLIKNLGYAGHGNGDEMKEWVRNHLT